MPNRNDDKPAGATHPFPPPAEGASVIDHGPTDPFPPPAAATHAVGSHVVRVGPAAPGDLPTTRYGIVLAVETLAGADEPAYRVGWLTTTDTLYPESDLATIAEHAERLADGR